MSLASHHGLNRSYLPFKRSDGTWDFDGHACHARFLATLQQNTCLLEKGWFLNGKFVDFMEVSYVCNIRIAKIVSILSNVQELMERKPNIGCECIHWHFSSRVFGPTLRLTWTRHLMWERFSQRSLRLWKSTGILRGWNQPGILKWDPCLRGIQHLQMYGNFEGFRFQSALLGVVIFHELCQPTLQMTWAMKNYHWLIWWSRRLNFCSATLFHPEYDNLIWESKKKWQALHLGWRSILFGIFSSEN